jgi:hypothetical protein
MGEARKKQQASKIVKSIEFSQRELVTLTLFLLQQVKPANRSQRKRFEELFNELGVDDIVAKIESPGGLKTAEVIEATGLVERPMSRASLSYLRECLDAEMAGLQALILGRIDNRVGRSLDDADGDTAVPANGAAASSEATPQD